MTQISPGGDDQHRPAPPLGPARTSPHKGGPPRLDGLIAGIAAMSIWGMFPLVFKTVQHVPALEVLAHRSAWGLVFVAMLMIAVGRGREIFSRAFYQPPTMKIMMVSAVIVAINWGVFVWAVANNLVLQSSLGYYISPLVSVLLGVVVLGERLRRVAVVAIALAAIGVVVLVAGVGEIPWVSFVLAASWATYGLVRKTAPLDSLPGLYMETLLMFPIALGYILWLGMVVGTGVFATSLNDSVLLALTGLVTAFPLLLFARAARSMRLATLGVLNYIVPTGQFSLAVFVFDEPFTTTHLIAFGCIWAGLALYAVSSLRRGRAIKNDLGP